jgi:segregation and condensation protein B
MSTEPTALIHVVEALIFASEKPISAREIAAALRGAAEAAKENAEVIRLAETKEDEIINAVDALAAEYAQSGRSFAIRETASGWQLVTSPAYGIWLRQLYPESKPARLSAPALETLAIIAYRQPVTRSDIEAVRGVAVDGVMQTLLDRNLVRIAGRAEIPGRPLLYETTHFFMEHFGLRGLDELPNAGELRRASDVIAEQHAAKLAAATSTAETPSDPQTSEATPAETIPVAESDATSHANEENSVPKPETAKSSESELASEPEITSDSAPSA